MDHALTTPEWEKQQCKRSTGWSPHRSYLGTGRMEVFDVELGAIRLMVVETVMPRERLQQHGVKTVAVCSDSQTAIR